MNSTALILIDYLLGELKRIENLNDVQMIKAILSDTVKAINEWKEEFDLKD